MNLLLFKSKVKKAAYMPTNASSYDTLQTVNPAIVFDSFCEKHLKCSTTLGILMKG